MKHKNRQNNRYNNHALSLKIISLLFLINAIIYETVILNI